MELLQSCIKPLICNPHNENPLTGKMVFISKQGSVDETKTRKLIKGKLMQSCTKPSICNPCNENSYTWKDGLYIETGPSGWNKNMQIDKMSSCYLSIWVILKLLSDEGIKDIPVVVHDVTTHRPQITEHKGCTQERVQLGGVLFKVWSTLGQHQSIDELTESGYLADVHLVKENGKNKTCFFFHSDIRQTWL